jgi:hypothetical protein
MGLEPIRVEMTDFNRMELLREEEDRLFEELSGIEKSIRDVHLLRARQEYLVSLAPAYYSGQPKPADAGPDLGKLEKQREVVFAALEVVRTQREKFESLLGGAADTGGGPGRQARPKGAAGSRSSSFQSFEDFRQGKG